MNVIKKYVLGLALLSALFMTACEDENGGGTGTGDVPPMITLDSASAADGELVSGGDVITFYISGIQGTNPLSGITVVEDGTTMDASRITVDGSTAANNPFVVSGEEISHEIAIVASEEVGIHNVTLRLSAQGGQSDDIFFEYQTEEEEQPELEVFEGVFFNADGQQFGSFDLDNVDSVCSTCADFSRAEIQDAGLSGETWLRQIQPVNNSLLVALSGEFDFDGTNTRQAIIDEFDNGQSISISDQVEVGDAFAVKRDDNYFVFIVRAWEDVEDDPNTSRIETNDDYYIIDIKKAQ